MATIGIDLGTTYSAVGILFEGTGEHGTVGAESRVEIVANDQGNRVTPSCVAFTEAGLLIGEEALLQASLNPENTVFEVKRILGGSYNDEHVQSDAKRWPFQVVEGDENRPMVQVMQDGETKRFYPEQISAHVLQRMKEIAETRLGGPVSSAVITVPAYFNNAQRQATKVAGRLAGLNVLRIINEPTAAALAHGVDCYEENRKALVFDFGGGTCDVSLLQIDDGIFSVLATAGNSRLGGCDLDACLMDECIRTLKDEHRGDVELSPRSLARLRSACERAKRTLSVSTSVQIELHNIHEGANLSLTVSRARFERICKAVFDSAIDLVRQLLQDAKIEPGSIDDLILVGGSSRVPQVRKLIKDFFNNKEPCSGVNPDEAIAYGATVQASIITNQSSSMNSLILLDVTPLSLGIEIQGGIFSKIVMRNTTIPISCEETYQTIEDDQTSILIQVFEGEREMTEDCNKLAEFKIKGLPKKPRGEAKVLVRFDIDTNGILSVRATDPVNNNSNAITLQKNDRSFDEELVQRMIADGQRYAHADAEEVVRVRARNELDECTYRANHWVSDQRKVLRTKSADAISSKIEEIRYWCENNANEPKQAYEDKKETLILFVNNHRGRAPIFN